jgi:hypothetical protein
MGSEPHDSLTDFSKHLTFSPTHFVVLAMLLYQTLPITPNLERRISDLARLIEGGHSGDSKESLTGGVTFVYDKSPQITQLSREWLNEVVSSDSLTSRTKLRLQSGPVFSAQLPA